MRIISVSYGHGTSLGDGTFHGSGKLYDYSTDKEYRTGDVVVVPVEHAKSHKLYNTIAVVRMTNDANSSAGMRKLEYLTDPQNNIKPKDVSMRLDVAKSLGLNVTTDRQVNITTLPGYSNRLSNEKWSEKQPEPQTRIISRG